MPNLLDQIEAEIAKTQDKIGRLNKKLLALREAANVVRPSYEDDEQAGFRAEQPVPRIPPKSIDGPSEPTQAANSEDMEGLTIVDAAVKVLDEAGDEEMHPDDVARVAVDRGYKSTSPRNPDNDFKKIATSFRVTMKRHPDKFTQGDKGFKLIR